MFPVNPAAKLIDGDTCYPNLAALKGKEDGVVVAVPAQQAVSILRDAVKAGIRNVCGFRIRLTHPRPYRWEGNWDST